MQGDNIPMVSLPMDEETFFQGEEAFTPLLSGTFHASVWHLALEPVANYGVGERCTNCLLTFRFSATLLR